MPPKWQLPPLPPHTPYQVRAVDTFKVQLPKYLNYLPEKMKTRMTSVNNYCTTISKGLNLWRSKSCHPDRITGTHTQMWTVTPGQSCELCLAVTMAKRDPPLGSSWAAPPPKAKDVSLNLWPLSSQSAFPSNPPPSPFQGSIFHLYLFPFLHAE